MERFLPLAFLFFIGSMGGWVLELVYRNSVSHSGKLINPGFCTGPYVPLYGFGLCVLYLLACVEQKQLLPNFWANRALTLVLMALAMTLLEYIAGIFCLKYFKVRLWDYSNCWGNIQGIICPIFSLAWAALAAAYLFFVHPHILQLLEWLSRNLAFSFFIGVFFGVFAIDVCHSAQIVVKLKQYAEENQVVVKFESIKHHLRQHNTNRRNKLAFFRPFHTNIPLSDALKELYGEMESRKNKKRK